MNYFQWYASSAGQAALLNTEPPTVKWLEGLNRLDDSDKYIELAPPYSGCGVLHCKTSCHLIVENKGATPAKVRFVIGVDQTNGSNKPVYPYLGVSHGPGDAITEYETLAPGEARSISLVRFDIVDNALQSDQPIAGWPNWTVAKGAGQPGLPIFCLCGNNDTPANAVYYRDVQFTVEA